MDIVGDAAEDAGIRESTFLRWAIVLLVAVGVVALVVQSGVIGRFSDEEELQRTINDAGLWGPVVFLLLMVLLVPFDVPGIIFVLPSTTIFGTAGGFVLSLTGGFLASSIGIVGSRWLGQSAFQSKIPDRVKRIGDWHSERGFWGMVGIRCVLFLAQPLDWLCGLSDMRLRKALTATFVGLIPPTLLIALTGEGLFGLLF